MSDELRTTLGVGIAITLFGLFLWAGYLNTEKENIKAACAVEVKSRETAVINICWEKLPSRDLDVVMAKCQTRGEKFNKQRHDLTDKLDVKLAPLRKIIKTEAEWGKDPRVKKILAWNQDEWYRIELEEVAEINLCNDQLKIYELCHTHLPARRDAAIESCFAGQ